MTDEPPTQLPGVTFTGTRLVYLGRGSGTSGDPSHNPDQQNEVGEGPEDGGSSPTQEEVDAENERQKECAAQKFKLELDTKTDKDEKEYFSYTWDQAGQTTTHPIRGGSSAVIQTPDRTAARSEFGISNSDVLAFNHNHPADVYCPDSGLTGQDQLRANAYPSESDWAFAHDAVLNRGVPSTLTLYISDCEGNVRGFDYSDMQRWKDAKTRNDRPPMPITPDCPE